MSLISIMHFEARNKCIFRSRSMTHQNHPLELTEKLNYTAIETFLVSDSLQIMQRGI